MHAAGAADCMLAGSGLLQECKNNSRSDGGLRNSQELQFVAALAPRMEEAAGKLGALLRAGLADALRAGNAPARQHCLQAFAAVGDAAGAEQAWNAIPSLRACA